MAGSTLMEEEAAYVRWRDEPGRAGCTKSGMGLISFPAFSLTILVRSQDLCEPLACSLYNVENVGSQAHKLASDSGFSTSLIVWTRYLKVLCLDVK